MRKVPRPFKSFPRVQNNSFSTLLDTLEPEREAQRQEYLRKIHKETHTTSPTFRKKPQKSRKLRGITFEEKLERTQRWLKETFPNLFDLSQPKALDVHIVRDVKEHYKQFQLKNKYPADLVIKAALNRYMETPEYRKCLEENGPRHNMEGQLKQESDSSHSKT